MAIKQVNLDTLEVSLWLEAGGYIGLYLGEALNNAAMWSFEELVKEAIDQHTVNGKVVDEVDKDELNETRARLQHAINLIDQAIEK